MFSWFFSVFSFGFVVGALAIVALEAVAFMLVLKRLNSPRQLEANSAESNRDLDPQQSLEFPINKEGFVWIFELDEVSKTWTVSAELKRRKEILEVSPVRKHGRIKDQTLVLTNTDGSCATIQLKGCIIEAVSATDLSSRKWAKRFPLKVESKTSVIYNGRQVFYMFLETSWEKESWCKALRVASCKENKNFSWFTKLNEEFRNYLTTLNTGYRSFMKPSAGLISEEGDKGNKVDVSSSRVRLLWKRFSKRALKSGPENRVVWSSPSSGREERKTSEKVPAFQDSVNGANFVKSAPTAIKVPNSIQEENLASSSSMSSSSLSHSASQSHMSVISDIDSEEKFTVDEGILCWNLLISRLFFDAKHNIDMKSFVQTRIQRTLSNLRTPSFIPEVTCTSIDIGNLPPYIHGMRVLPMDMDGVWAFEVDIEYSGGAILDVKTRLEVSEIDMPKGEVDTRSEPGPGDANTDLLEGVEHLEKQLNLSEGTNHAQDHKIEGDAKNEGSKGSKSTIGGLNNISKWKAVFNSVAKQVSQVPIALSIRVASIRGTLRLRIKPPPSDQLWFGFTSMPDIEFDLASSIGDHKITSGQVAMLLINRFKAAIRDTMVHPNCESVCIPWMLAEKNDWIARKVAPFIWLNPETASNNDALAEAFKSKGDSNKGNSNHNSETTNQKQKVESIQQPVIESPAILPAPVVMPVESPSSLQELAAPLLPIKQTQDASRNQREDIPGYSSLQSRSLLNFGRQNSGVEDDDSKAKKGKKARMFDLGKKVTEKLEEKRRQVEERSRHIVEKMRGPT